MKTSRATSEAMHSAAVRAALQQRAQQIASRANALGSAEGVDMNARVSVGTRPKGRPYAVAESDNVSQEWGNRFVKRRRIMGRAAGL